ncbi:MAG TPA: serine protease [Acidobacteriota bacterium]
MACFAAVLAVLSVVLAGGLQYTLPRDVRARIIPAVVEIVPVDAAGQEVGIAGSGTIISPDGYILTNFHVIGVPASRERYADFAILQTRPGFFDQAPEFLYRASYVAGDPTHDLAILRIDRHADGSALAGSTTFASITVGSSNETMPGDPITIIGYPGISGRTITFTAGLLSGWVGEDLEAGGKQWIKTDAKIAYGNSGGAAVNELGELIGVPTAGRTERYGELDVEEQAYVRPIGLAWSLIGPYVANVSRAAPPPEAGVRVADTTRPAPAPGAGDGSGLYGEVPVGGERTGVIAGYVDAAVYHTYTVSAPPGLSRLSIDVDGNGKDIDFAVKAGSAITSFASIEEGGDADFIDLTTATYASHAYLDPAAGVVYVDVINLIPEPVSYVLRVSAVGGAQPPGAGGQPPVGGGQPLVAGTAESGTIGQLADGQSASGRLASAVLPRWHTYYIDAPSWASTMEIAMSADADLDLAAKFGAEIENYDSVDYRDESASHDAALSIPSPQTGRWYIDVFTRYDITGSYKLTVRFR